MVYQYYSQCFKADLTILVEKLEPSTVGSDSMAI